MASIFHNTVLGYVLGLDTKAQEPDLEASPSWWLPSENYKLSLKLESARMPANCRNVPRETVYIEDDVSMRKLSSMASNRSDDTQANLERCVVADRALGRDKLERARMPANCRDVRRETVYIEDDVSMRKLPSMVYNRSSDTQANLERCVVANRALGWDGPDDPENPLNFSPARKAFIEICIHLLTLCAYIGTSIFSPGIASLRSELHASQTVATLGTSLSIFGYAIGPMLWSPVSECPSIGRTPVYLATLGIFVLIQLPIATATNIETVLVFRFFSGVFGSPPQAMGGATLSDIYAPCRRSYAVGLWELSAWVAPVLGPLVGGLAAEYLDWRWTVWELLAMNSVMFLVVFSLLPETSAPTILYRHAKRLRSSDSSKASTDDISPRQSVGALIHQTLVRPFTLCFREPICLLLNTYTAVLTGLFFAWFETLPIVLVDVYKLDLIHLGLAFLGLFLGATTAFLLFSIWFRCSESKKFDRAGKRKPEERFIPLMAGCVFIPISLFVFGWTAREDISCLVPIIGSGIFSLGSFSLFISILNYLPDAYPEHAASVLAGNNFLRCTSGAISVVVAAPLYKNLGPAWASTILALVGCAFVPVPFLFYLFGDRIRRSSRHALKDM